MPGIQESELNGRNMLIKIKEYTVVKNISFLIFSFVTRNEGKSLLPKRNVYFLLFCSDMIKDFLFSDAV